MLDEFSVDSRGAGDASLEILVGTGLAAGTGSSHPSLSVVRLLASMRDIPGTLCSGAGVGSGTGLEAALGFGGLT